MQCKAIDFENEKPEDYKIIIRKMTEVMLNNRGMGLAANQVSFDKRLIIINLNGHVISLLNPKIIEETGKFISNEGCLSFKIPEIKEFKIKRRKKVLVEYHDENFQLKKLYLYNMHAACVQHEIDHLMGVTIYDTWLKQRKGIKYF